MLLNHLAGDAALGVLSHDVIDHVARLLRDRRFRQIKIHAVEQPADDLCANGLGLRIFQLILQVSPHAGAQLLQVFRVVLFGERVVHRRQNFFLYLNDFNFKNALFAREFLRHEIGREIHADRALVARLGAAELLGKTGQERLRPDVHPEIFLLRQAPWPSARCR